MDRGHDPRQKRHVLRHAQAGSGDWSDEPVAVKRGDNVEQRECQKQDSDQRRLCLLRAGLEPLPQLGKLNCLVHCKSPHHRDTRLIIGTTQDSAPFCQSDSVAR
jgi:hypothetical protein